MSENFNSVLFFSIALAIISFIIAFVAYKKAKSTNLQVQILKSEILQLQDQVSNLERKIAAKEIKESDASIIDHFTLLQPNSEDSPWKKNSKDWVKKAYHHPDATLRIVTATWVILRKLIHKGK